MKKFINFSKFFFSNIYIGIKLTLIKLIKSFLFMLLPISFTNITLNLFEFSFVILDKSSKSFAINIGLKNNIELSVNIL